MLGTLASGCRNGDSSYRLTRALSPHFLDGHSHVDDPVASRRGCLTIVARFAPSAPVECSINPVWNKPADGRICMPVAGRRLVMRIEPLWYYQIQFVLSSVIATCSSRRSSSISSGVPVAISDGIQPSMTFRTRTFSTWPFAE